MAGVTFHTWRDLLLPIDHLDTRIVLPRVDESEGQTTAQATPLSLVSWDPKRLPPTAHLVTDLPSKMQEHLRVIID
jgi:hypothetical protein